jgi:hypothetical protein
VVLDVVFRPQAEDEVLEVREWSESKRFGLGREFGDELYRIVAHRGRSPSVSAHSRRGSSSRAIALPVCGVLSSN